MDSGVVDRLSEKENGEAFPRFSFTEIFWKKFPYYLSIGMTESQYWDGDCRLAEAFRKADNLKKERTNSELWLQGMYVYDAISRLVPVLHAFSKKGAKPLPYPEEPYALNDKEVKSKEERKAKAVSQKGLMFMESFAMTFNKRFENENVKEGESSADNN